MALENLGNGIGLLYVTDASGNILDTWNNTQDGAISFLNAALTAAPLSGEVLATALINIASVTGTGHITNITVNGVSIMNATASNTTPTALATDAATIINSYISSPDYTAFASTGNITLSAVAGSGATPNGYVVVVSSSNSSITNNNMSGGSITSGTYSTAFNGRRFYIYADAAAVLGTISSSTEVSNAIISKGSQAARTIQAREILTNAISVQRENSAQIVQVDTQAGGPTSTLQTIATTGYIDGDTLQLVGADPTHVVTVNTSGNIVLANSVPFVSGDASNVLTVQYSVSLDKFVELSRTPGLNFTATSVRAQGIPYPQSGVTNTTLTNGGGTITLSPGSSTQVQYLTGTPSLSSSWSVVGGGSPINGDIFQVIYRAVPTLNSNTVTIFGKTLTSIQAVSGQIYAIATYRSASSSYDCVILDDVSGIDFATTSAVAAKENALGNPAADGYLLASTAAGARYWTPPTSGGSNNIVLSAPDHADVQTGANTTPTTLKTYTLLANTFLTDQSQIVIESRGYLGSDGNSKNIKIYFGSQFVGSWTNTLSGDTYKIVATVTRGSGTTQFGDVVICTSTGVVAVFANVAMTQNLSTDITLSIVGTNGSAVAGDIICSYMSVKLFAK